MLSLAAAITQFHDRIRDIVQQPLPIFRIRPGPGDHPGTISRTNFILVEIDNCIQIRGINQALETALTELGLINTADLDAIVDLYQNKLVREMVQLDFFDRGPVSFYAC